jgi:hypothetical protein
VKNSSATPFGTWAYSSNTTQLNDPPRIAEELVAAATIFDSFSSSTDVLLNVTTPCCNHNGKFAYAFWYLSKISVANLPLLAKIAIELHWPMVYIYPKNQ